MIQQQQQQQQQQNHQQQCRHSNRKNGFAAAAGSTSTTNHVIVFFLCMISCSMMMISEVSSFSIATTTTTSRKQFSLPSSKLSSLTSTRLYLKNGNSKFPSFPTLQFPSQQPAETATNIPPENVRVLILPGFGNDSSDYLLEQAPQGSLVESLQTRGWKPNQIRILKVNRSDWLQVFTNGLFDLNFWKGTAAPTQPCFAWYLNRIAETVNELIAGDNDANDDEQQQKDNDIQVVLVCHSAGGWLARAALGFCSFIQNEATETAKAVGSKSNNKLFPRNKVLGVVTLGAPHVPPPPEVMDMTRGALRITHETFPGAYFSSSSSSSKVDDDLFYVTVIGTAIQGKQQEKSNPFEPTTLSGFAYTSYEAVCGNGTEIGDGVVPVCSAHLDDAIELTLPNVFHSINAPDQWYGSDKIIDSWHSVMLQEINKRLERKKCSSTVRQQSTPLNLFENLFR